MKKTALEIYALAVCFVTVVCLVISLGIAIYAVVGIVNPEFTMPSWTYEQHQTNDAFWNGPIAVQNIGTEDKQKNRPNESDLTKRRNESFTLALASERRSSWQTLVKTLIVALIDLIVFLFHWRIARQARSSAA